MKGIKYDFPDIAVVVDAVPVLTIGMGSGLV
jgi:hypothetical protein